ncbi:MAG: chloride channel protein [Anaerolineae bacterium]|nr:chloride channel protein [Anaerolineae bacterium]
MSNERGLSARVHRLAHLIDRWQPSEAVVLVGTALLVGLGTGLGALAFIWLLRVLQRFFTQAGAWLQARAGPAGLVLVPVLGALIAGPLITFFAREAKGHGVPEVMQAIALRGGRIRPVVALIKALASAACISSGGSAGREGPIVQIGSALGSTVGQLFRLSDDRIRNLVACGAASGIAAVFNAPIAGVIFALEVILGEFTTRYFGSVVIAAVTSSIVSRAFLGDRPAFRVPAYTLVSPWELPLYTLLGVLTALGAILFVRTLYWFEDRFDGWRFPDLLKPAAGGLLTGAVGLWFPQVLGAGLEFIGESISSGSTVLGLALALCVVKILATSFTLGSGNSGGVFAPALFSGAMLGQAFGGMAHRLWPELTAVPGAYALVGMAAFFAAAAHAPITAVLIVFEMSGDYRLILPLMFATVISTLLSEQLHPESIYSLKLVRRGIHLERGHDIDVMQGITVGEAMTPNPETVSLNTSLRELADRFATSHYHGYPVLDEEGRLCGVVTLQDLERVTQDGRRPPGATVAHICTRNPLVAYPDEPLWAALKRIGSRDIGRLPVVSREDPTKLVGLIRGNDIIRAYNKAIARRVELQHRSERLRLGKLTGTEFVEVEVHPASGVVGRRISELSLPGECVLVSIQRGRRLIIPHGATVLEAGDRVTALVDSQGLEAFHPLFKADPARQEELERRERARPFAEL